MSTDTLVRPLRLLVADDFPLIRLAVLEQLHGRGFVICGEAEDAEGAVDLARRLRPDICLLDVRMPGGGIEAARTIVAEVPETHVVLMTMAFSEEDMLAAVSAGAAGYLAKDLDFDRLALILSDVAAGEVAFPRSLMRRLVPRFRHVLVQLALA